MANKHISRSSQKGGRSEGGRRDQRGLGAAIDRRAERENAALAPALSRRGNWTAYEPDFELTLGGTYYGSRQKVRCSAFVGRRVCRPELRPLGRRSGGHYHLGRRVAFGLANWTPTTAGTIATDNNTQDGSITVNGGSVLYSQSARIGDAFDYTAQ